MNAFPVVERALAKLNLALHVTGRRADGYHLLDSLVAFCAYGDQIILNPGPLSLAIRGEFAGNLAPDDDNLCLRAARMMAGEAAITLEKRLPVASGIGGGSADAAAVLRGFARLGARVPDDLWRLGADVPVCLLSAPARMSGIGEDVTPLPALPTVPVVLVNPGVAVSTPGVFAAMTNRENPPLPFIPEFADAAQLIGWLGQTRNDLETPAIATAPVIADVLGGLLSTGAGFARMSGSGATCFGIYGSASRAENAAATLKQNGWWAVASELARPAPRG
jgi:4-diphosphocytidyl-2-C-methyl-D-erythritol kinase